jgi:hypothetical protein
VRGGRVSEEMKREGEDLERGRKRGEKQGN